MVDSRNQRLYNYNFCVKQLFVSSIKLNRSDFIFKLCNAVGIGKYMSTKLLLDSFDHTFCRYQNLTQKTFSELEKGSNFVYRYLSIQFLQHHIHNQQIKSNNIMHAENLHILTFN